MRQVLSFLTACFGRISQVLALDLCIPHSSGICTKTEVLSTQGSPSQPIDITEEEMTEPIVAYVRVSSREQAENTHALEQQRQRVLDAGAQQIFQDVQNRGSRVEVMMLA
jgi:hypothetical protein